MAKTRCGCGSLANGMIGGAFPVVGAKCVMVMASVAGFQAPDNI